MRQWMLKITAYADRLLEDLDELDWPEGIKAMQRNWIGRSEGAEITFVIDGSKELLTVYTTRPETIWGATFIVCRRSIRWHPSSRPRRSASAVDAYLAHAAALSEVEKSQERAKTGVFTGAYAINPATGAPIPVWIADYVLMGYGSGAIMAVPAHDDPRPRLRASVRLADRRVIDSAEGIDIQTAAYEGDGTLSIPVPERSGTPAGEAS